MVLPAQITFRNMESLPMVEQWIRQEAEKLDQFCPQIMSCRVVVEQPSRRRKLGTLYHVRIDVTVPGGELVVKRQPSLHSVVQPGEEKRAKHLEITGPHKNLRQAIDDGFRAMGRRLQDYVRRQRHQVKTHEPTPRARVSKLFPAEGYGFLETPGGRAIYFHKNSVLDGELEELRVGQVVKFVEEPGENGPQASTVRPLHRVRRQEGAPWAQSA
jgi:cold shock CspA family protein